MRRDIAAALKLIGERKLKLASDGGLCLGAPKTTNGKPNARGPSTHLPAEAVRAMVSEGLLSRVRGTVERTVAGRAFLRRAMATAGDDGFAAQHQSVGSAEFDVGGAKRALRVNTSESPLGWLASRKGPDGEPMISPLQKRAGDRLASDHERGHQRERITQNWDASAVRGTVRRDGLSVSDAAIAARERVEGALSSVGPGLAEVLVGICCEELGLEAVEKRLGWPARSGKVVLRLALDRLAAHYGMGGRAEGVASVMVHWGCEGYRPTA